MGRSARHLFKDTKGAVAATVALSLFALIAAGGLAFDYARLAGLHTELQQAADQAALAAASQLDGQTDATDRADKAITIPNSGSTINLLAANFTRFANDTGVSTVQVTTAYCSDFDDTIADVGDKKGPACTPAATQASAKFVVVTTATRIANYALTPIVGAIPGSVSAKAVAGVQSSVCDIAPLVVCAPTPSFPTSTDIGKGIILKPLKGTSGNYGLLDFGSGLNGAFDALLGFGLNGCQLTSATVTEPGTKTPVTNALNSRLDIYDNKACNGSNVCESACDTSTGSGCPAVSARKDMVVRLADTTFSNTTGVAPTQTQANAAAAVCPSSPTGLVQQVPVSPVVGFPRDTCHYTSCTGTGYAANVGDGAWTRQAYFDANHPGMESAAAASAGKAFASLSRYDVYKWELTSKATLLANQRTVTIVTPPATSTKKGVTTSTWTIQTQCGYPQSPTALTSYPKQKDRRVLPIVTADCTAFSGKTSFAALRAFDVFLNEPSVDRTYPGVTDGKEIYAEIVGPSSTAEGGSGFQYYSRNKPYLVR